MGYGRWLDIHEVLEAPERFGVTEIELDWEAERGVFDEGVIGQVQVAAKLAFSSLERIPCSTHRG